MLYEETQGWAGGLVLTAAAGPARRFEASVPGARHQVLFDYFAGEIFATLSPPKQRILAVSALLGEMSLHDVIELTDFADAGELLQDLNQRNYFTLRVSTDPGYEYHPLFRDFLRARATQLFAAAELAPLRKAAGLLEADDHIEEAAELLCAADDTTGCRDSSWACSGIRGPGPLQGHRGLAALSAGRTSRLRIHGCSIGTASAGCPTDPALARIRLEQAYAQFKSGGDVLGQCRCLVRDRRQLRVQLERFQAARSLDRTRWISCCKVPQQVHGRCRSTRTSPAECSWR